MNPLRPPTQKAVADRAGVTQAAVSAVLAGQGGSIRVGAAARQRIIEAAQELGYRPVRAGSILETGRLPQIGICCVGVTSHQDRWNLLSTFLAGIEDQATASGYDLVLHAWAFPPADGPFSKNWEQACNQTAGTILLGEFEGDGLDDIAEQMHLLGGKHPLVSLGHRKSVPQSVSQVIAVNNIDVLVRELLKINHREIIYVGTDTPLETDITLEHEFERVMAEHQLTLRVQRPTKLSSELFQEIHEQSIPFLLFEHDTLAFKWWEVSKPYPRKAPRDYSYAFFTSQDSQPSATGIASLQLPTSAMGREAVAILDRVLKGGAPETQWIDCVLNHGKTTRKIEPFNPRPTSSGN